MTDEELIAHLNRKAGALGIEIIFKPKARRIRRRGSHPIGRPLNGETPTIDLVVGYHKLKHPQFLRTFLSKMARTNEQAKANSYLW